MILIEITALPAEIQKDSTFKRAFKNLKVWSRNVKGKFVAQKEDIVNALRTAGKKKAATFFENTDISEVAFSDKECVLTKY